MGRTAKTASKTPRHKVPTLDVPTYKAVIDQHPNDYVAAAYAAICAHAEACREYERATGHAVPTMVGRADAFADSVRRHAAGK